MLEARVRVNDGAIVYLNGIEVLRHNMAPGAVTHTTHAAAENDARSVTYAVDPGHLGAGTNVVAVEVHTAMPDTSQLLFDLGLVANLPWSPPYIQISAPENGTITQEQAIRIETGISDQDGQAVLVEFYANGNK